MPLGRHLSALALSLAVAGCGRAEPGRGPLSLAQVSPRQSAPLQVASDAVGPDGAIGRRWSAYGDNLSPPLTWTPVAGAATYVVIVEDPDAPGDAPFVHWLIWNIPGGQAALPAGIASGGRPPTPAGAAQGRNGAGQIGYFGPRPPPGTGAHHYHLEVFALDAPLPSPAGTRVGALVAAMRGHVIADGELVGAFSAPPS
jgi:hypothetical protein